VSKCPHTDVHFCPLYVASHMAAGGCDDGKLETGACAIARGMHYRQMVEFLRVSVPGLVERLEFLETGAAAKKQHSRNLRLNGIH